MSPFLLSLKCTLTPLLFPTESYDSGSHLPPRIQQLRPEQPSVRPNNPAGLDSQIDVTSFMQSIEPSMSHSQVAIREPLYQDELPPPELSAPPASIPFVQSQQEIPSEEQLFQHYIAEPSSEPGDSEQIAVTIAPNSASSKEADAGTALQDRDGAFTFNFSQDPDAFDRSPRLAHVSDSNLEKVTEETEPETFGIHASQVMELDAFTQV